MKVKLIERVTSIYRIVYGEAGDEVEVISDLGEVLIVKGRDDETFPVHKRKTSMGFIPAIKPYVKPEPVDPPPAPVIEMKSATKKEQVKPQPLQQSLF